MHGIDLKTQMDIVYHSLNDTFKGIIDAACNGAFKRRSAEEAKQLIEDLTKCNMKAPSESLGSNNRTRGSGVIELNKMTAMEAKLDAIMHKLGNQEKRMHYAHEIGAVGRDGFRRSAEGPIEEDPLSRPDSRSDSIGGSKPVSGTRDHDWDSLPDFFFFLKANRHLWVWPTSYNRITRTTTGVVSIKIYTHITESHLQIQNYTFTFTNQSTEPTCSEPLQVCWPSCMRMFADVISCTYTE